MQVRAAGSQESARQEPDDRARAPELISANDMWLKALYACAWNCTCTRSVTGKFFESTQSKSFNPLIRATLRPKASEVSDQRLRQFGIGHLVWRRASRVGR
jgi:hypothetical protein